jgi:prepilin-type N-terminal cleavage/methylation domain-containing protein
VKYRGVHRQSGFTLVELLVAVAVSLVLLAVGAPSFLAWLPTMRLSSAARQVATDLQAARMKAISQNASFTVTFNTGAGTYSYGADSRDIPEQYPGISIASVSPSNPVFTPRGTANGSVTITLNNGATQKLVCVKTVGRVNIADGSSCT